MGHDTSNSSSISASPNPPTVLTGEASGLTQSSATLSATVNPNGGALSECKLEYGSSTAYGSSAPCSSPPGSGESLVAVSAQIAGLSANTAYHFRVSATNASGTSQGADKAFATPPATGGGAAGPGSGGSPGGGGARPLPAVTLLSRSLVASRSGVLAVELLCPVGESTCIGKITLRARTLATTGARSKRSKSMVTLTHAPFAPAGGQTKALKLRLRSPARALLSRTSKLRGGASIVAHDAAGAGATTLASVTIRVKR